MRACTDWRFVFLVNFFRENATLASGCGDSGPVFEESEIALKGGGGSRAGPWIPEGKLGFVSPHRNRNQSAARSLAEGLEDTLTLHRLGVFPLLGLSFKTTNCLESINALVEERCAKVDRWTNSNQRQRWLAMDQTEFRVFEVSFNSITTFPSPEAKNINGRVAIGHQNTSVRIAQSPTQSDSSKQLLYL